MEIMSHNVFYRTVSQIIYNGIDRILPKEKNRFYVFLRIWNSSIVLSAAYLIFSYSIFYIHFDISSHNQLFTFHKLSIHKYSQGKKGFNKTLCIHGDIEQLIGQSIKVEIVVLMTWVRRKCKCRYLRFLYTFFFKAAFIKYGRGRICQKQTFDDEEDERSVQGD